MAPNATAGISLPTSIVSPTDIARLSREIESLELYFQEQQIRNHGVPNAMPRMSKLMDQLASDNQMNLLLPEHRQAVRQLLDQLHRSAPVMHISFSVDPPGAYVQKIIDWLRQNIHQHILVTVGLQPNIGAGCIVRTTNRMFDFSLREFFATKRPFFIEKLHQAIVGGEEFSEPSQPASSAVAPIAEVQPAVQAQPTNPAPQLPTEAATIATPAPAPEPSVSATLPVTIAVVAAPSDGEQVA